MIPKIMTRLLSDPGADEAGLAPLASWLADAWVGCRLAGGNWLTPSAAEKMTRPLKNAMSHFSPPASVANAAVAYDRVSATPRAIHLRALSLFGPSSPPTTLAVSRVAALAPATLPRAVQVKRSFTAISLRVVREGRCDW